MADIPVIHRLITFHAERGRMLFRAHGELYEHLRDFFVAAEGETVVGCCALELVWRDLAEVKSLAVDETRRGGGIGKRLVTAAVKEGRRLGLERVFALTREQAFFERLDFVVVGKETLPHKVWTDCIKCPVQHCCDEIAVVRTLTGEANRVDRPGALDAGHAG
jgi:amino-acid N-acetyltransferase